MAIKNIEGLTDEDIRRELDNGAKFVVFNYCISILILTFKRNSSIYFIRRNESTLQHHWKHTGLSLLIGWWGIPWGPIYTIGSLFTNLSGGKDVTHELLASLNNNNTSEAQ